MHRRFLLMPVFLVTLACERPAAEPAAGVPDEATGRREVEQLRDAWVAAAERDDAPAVAALYAEDAVFVSTETGPARGRAAIQEMLSQSFPVSTLENIASSDLVVSGDLANDYGEFTQRFHPAGAPQQTIRGHYSVTLRRHPDGAWRIIRHLSTTPQAAAPAAGR